MITPEQIRQIAPHCGPNMAKALAEHLTEVQDKFAIETPLRLAHFLAQCAHESTEFTAFEENLMYSGGRLLEVFPRYFRGVNVSLYSKNPEKIANRVYASRMGNGPESSGDGYKFRGRGPIQLTGRSNYTECSDVIGHDLVEDPDFASTPQGGLLAAGWFWDTHHLNTLADADNVTRITQIINGGLNGLDDRKAHLSRAKSVLGVH